MIKMTGYMVIMIYGAVTISGRPYEYTIEPFEPTWVGWVLITLPLWRPVIWILKKMVRRRKDAKESANNIFG